MKSAQSGKLFKITKAKVDRNGYGASLTGIKVKFVKGAAKKINKRLELNSLKKGNAGSIKLSYTPETVKIIGGTAQTTSAPVNLLDTNGEAGGSVGAKLLLGHCVSGIGNGITPIAPATKEVLGPLGPAIFRFPVVDGEISLDGTEGLSEASGGLTIRKSENGAPPSDPGCNSNPYGELSQQAITTDITARTISSEVNIVASRVCRRLYLRAGTEGKGGRPKRRSDQRGGHDRSGEQDVHPLGEHRPVGSEFGQRAERSVPMRRQLHGRWGPRQPDVGRW